MLDYLYIRKRMDVFSEEGKDDILLSTVTRLVGGEHTMTSFKLYDENSVLLAEDNNQKTFKVDIFLFYFVNFQLF